MHIRSIVIYLLVFFLVACEEGKKNERNLDASHYNICDIEAFVADWCARNEVSSSEVDLACFGVYKSQGQEFNAIAFKYLDGNPDTCMAAKSSIPTSDSACSSAENTEYEAGNLSGQLVNPNILTCFDANDSVEYLRGKSPDGYDFQVSRPTTP